MASASFTIHTTVPAPDQPGAPFLVCYDNGDWEFTHAHEVEHLSGLFAAENMASILSEISLEYGDDEMDEVDGESLLDLDITVISAGPQEAVLALCEDGMFFVMIRAMAEDTIEHGGDVYNFIPLADLLDEFKRYLKNNRAAMFAYIGDEPLDLGEFFEED